MSTPSHPTPVGPVDPAHGRWRPLGLDSVRLTEGYWADWQRLNAAAIIGHCDDWIERLGWSGNFDAAVRGDLPGARRGREFSDSEVYKLMEAMAWEVARSGDQELDQRLRSLTDRVAAAQEPDGYISTMFGRPGQGDRYSDLTWGHELYCIGHLIQAGVARGRTAGLDDRLVQVAVAAADQVCREFGAEARQGYCGHPEIEVALIELSRLTGDERYRDQARLFIRRRGSGLFEGTEIGRAYFQDDLPVRQATVLRGHAVRALYLQSAVVDQAVDDQDDDLLGLAASQMLATLARRTHLTGGMGSRHDGEAFGEDWELPADRAYCETCAGVASVMANHRLVLATGDPRFADAVERTLFNLVATSPAGDGHSFFYANPLRQVVTAPPSGADEVSPRASTGSRAPWFEVSCCPNNLARTFASLAAYLASADEGGIQIHQYAGAEIETVLPAGRVRLRMETGYPASGRVLLTVAETPDDPWTLTLRVPAWAGGTGGARLTTAEGTTPVEAGQVRVRRRFRPGETVALDLDLAPRWTWPDRRIDGLRGTVAVERGPLVMALESVDLGADAGRAVVRTDEPPLERGGRVLVPIRLAPDPVDGWPYGTKAPGGSAAPMAAGLGGPFDQGRPADGSDRLPGASSGTGPAESAPERLVPLIPYHDWAERGPSTMRVWLPTA